MKLTNSLTFNAISIIFSIDVNECASSPCLNGGTCTEFVNGYTCACASGYAGIHCETGMAQLIYLIYLPVKVC